MALESPDERGEEAKKETACLHVASGTLSPPEGQSIDMFSKPNGEKGGQAAALTQGRGVLAPENALSRGESRVGKRAEQCYNIVLLRVDLAKDHGDGGRRKTIALVERVASSFQVVFRRDLDAAPAVKRFFSPCGVEQFGQVLDTLDGGLYGTKSDKSSEDAFEWRKRRWCTRRQSW